VKLELAKAREIGIYTTGGPTMTAIQLEGPVARRRLLCLALALLNHLSIRLCWFATVSATGVLHLKLLVFVCGDEHRGGKDSTYARLRLGIASKLTY
jgi:hypothetical protein